ncbi:MAG: FAD-dependent oxidoreductase [Albidovulum sp.]|nr:FAD-dependent oxidoreductase [Albidovulum sp.]
MTRSADCIIIGAGIIGAAIALELSRKGFRTISVDRNPAAGYGPTSGSCAIIRVHYSTLEGTAFAWEGYHYWKNWDEYLGVRDPTGMAEFREIGCLVMKTEGNKFLEKHGRLSRELGIPCESWDASEVESRLPIYSLQSYSPVRRMDDEKFGEANGSALRGALFWKTAGYVTDPQLSTRNIQCACEASGGTFLFGREVAEVIIASDRVAGARLDDGSELHAPIVVNVAGPWSSHVNRMAGADRDMTISTKALKQEVAHVPAPEGFDFYKNGFVISDSDIGCYVRPEKGNFILIGSEDPACDPREFVDPDKYDRDFSEQWTHQVYRYAQRVPSLGIPSRMRGVVDLYDVADDWIPVYDKSSVPGFYMAIGTSGNQYKNAPIAGKLMAELIEYCEAGNDHDNAPLKFKLPCTEQSIDTSFYSRKREINKESSFSVLG